MKLNKSKIYKWLQDHETEISVLLCALITVQIYTAIILFN
jgi:hypothetical protein